MSTVYPNQIDEHYKTLRDTIDSGTLAEVRKLITKWDREIVRDLLVQAVLDGHINTAELLLKFGAEQSALLSYHSSEGDNILVSALKAGCRKTLKYLSSYPLLITQLLSDKSKTLPAIRDAICRGQLNLVFEYLHLNQFDLLQFNEPDESLLQHCVNKAYLEGLKALLGLESQRSMLQTPDSKGLTPLMQAILASHQNLAIVKILLAAGIEVSGSKVSNLKDYRSAETNESILALAAKTCSSEMLDFLLKLDGIQELLAIKDSDKKTPVITAAMDGKIENMKLLLHYRESQVSLLQYRNSLGATILDYAVSQKNSELITCICEAVQEKSAEGMTALVLAFLSGNLEIVHRLLAAQASINGLLEFRDASGKNLLQVLAAKGFKEEVELELTRLLLKLPFDENDLKLAFCDAINHGSTGIIKTLYFHNPKLGDYLQNWRDEVGNSVLMFAAIRNHLKMLHCFFESRFVRVNDETVGDILLNVSNNAGKTPLIKATLGGNDSITSLLLIKGASTKEVFSYQEKGENLLMICIKNNIVPQALQLIPNFSALIKPVLDARFENGNTILHEIIANGTTETGDFIKRLLIQFPDLRQLLAIQNKNRETPLLLAVLRDKVGVSKVLLKLNNNCQDLLSFKFEFGSIMAYVAYHGSLEMLQFLLSLQIGNRSLKDITSGSVPIWNKSKYSLESIIILRGDQRIATCFGIKLLECLEQNLTFESGNSILPEAAMIGFKLGVQNLLKIEQFKAKIRVRDNLGHTPTIKAIMHGHQEIAKLLQENGGESLEELATFKDLNGNTLLNLSIQSNSETMVAELLNNPLYQKNIDNAPMSPLIDAAIKRNSKIFRWLLEAGANIESIAFDKFKLYPLKEFLPYDAFTKMLRAAFDIMKLSRITIPKSEMTAKILEFVNCLKAGASPHQRDVDGNTPLHLAAKAGNYFFVDFLLHHKAHLLAKNNSNETPMQLAERSSSMNKATTIASLYVAMTALQLSGTFSMSTPASDLIQVALKAAYEIKDADEHGAMIIACIQKISDHKEIFQRFKPEDILRILHLIKENSLFFKQAQFELAKIYFNTYKNKVKQAELSFLEDSDLRNAFLCSHKADNYAKSSDSFDAEKLRQEIMKEYTGTSIPFGDLRSEEGSLSLIMAFGKKDALESENEALKAEKQLLEADCDHLKLELALQIPDRKRKRGEDSELDCTETSEKPKGIHKAIKNRKFM